MTAKERKRSEKGADGRGGILFVVATPIGNLEDITHRAVRVLRSADRIAAEDTRRTRALLGRYGIRAPLVSLHAHNERRVAPGLLQRLGRGERIVLVSDAGTPLVSDPGGALVRGAAARGYPVSPIPGPSAVTALLSVAGLPADSVLFLGFLPRSENRLRSLFEEIAPLRVTVVFYESPLRVGKTLKRLRELLGDLPAAVGREMTKRFEEIVRGSLSEVCGWSRGKRMRGELTVAVAIGGGKAGGKGGRGNAARMLRKLRADGFSLRDASARVAEATGLSRREVYQMGVSGGKGARGGNKRI